MKKYMKKVYLSNYYSNAHTIYKDMIENSTLKDSVNYIPIKKTKYYFHIKRLFLNLLNFKLPFYENEIIKWTEWVVFNLWIINYSNLDSYFFLEHFFILNTNFKILRIWFIKNNIIKILENSKCKWIVCLSKEAKIRIDNYFWSEIIKNKTTHIYPSIGYIENGNFGKDNSKFKVLFISNWDFISKWWREVLRCYEKFFKNNSEFEFIIKCNYIPTEYKVTWNNIKYIESNIPYKDIESLYQDSHILLQPLYKSWYWVFLEAMKYWLPIITSKVFDIPEIVKNWENWYTIDFVHSLFDTKDFYKVFNSINDFDKYIIKSNVSDLAIDEMHKKIINLKENKELYNTISSNNISEVKTWRFSRKNRDNSILNLITKNDHN